MATKKVADSAMMSVRSSWHEDLTTPSSRGKWLCFCLLACVLFAFIHFLLELPCLFLVDEGQAGHTLFELEGMEEGSVLVVLESVIYFLIPDNASVCRRDIDKFDPEGISDKVVRQNDSALESRVGPSIIFVGKSHIESRDGDSLDFVGSLGNRSLDSLLVSVREDGWHGCNISAEDYLVVERSWHRPADRTDWVKRSLVDRSDRAMTT